MSDPAATTSVRARASVKPPRSDTSPAAVDAATWKARGSRAFSGNRLSSRQYWLTQVAAGCTWYCITLVPVGQFSVASHSTVRGKRHAAMSGQSINCWQSASSAHGTGGFGDDSAAPGIGKRVKSPDALTWM